MTIRSSKDIEAEKDGVTIEAANFIGGLKRELETAKTERLTESHQKELETKITQAQAMYDGILNRLEGELNTARETEIRAEAIKESRIKANAAQEKESMKTLMKASWLANNGDPDVFEEMFPQMYAAEMAKRATLQEAQPNRAQQAVINKSF